ncbi:cysteine--tRNA ligase [Tabrizicola sp.]|uniref:cysteine--tRNA ligase n=1 Tax=Tabrizicola sp. TaxID=2005166 RepID=UPI0035B247ED
MVTIRLTNSKTRKKEDFVPIDPSNVRMYVCGPTVYDRAHLGNARPVVVFDTLYRLLRHVYGPEHVTYVRNFTDVDDKINAEALRRQKAGSPGTLEELIHQRTEETIAWYHADMDALGALRPSVEPRATEFIGQMIAMTEGLIASGHAYAVEGHVLFRVRSYKDYGKLSGRSVDDMIAGARVEVAPFKEDPMDFVLWKPSSGEEPGWASPWGKGRPGWHIECSAMAHELLGESFDIHGGGLDLQFPHHENEIAQSACAHPQGDFAHYWLHNEMLQVEGKKMSKSLGNFFTVRDLLDQGTPGEVIRFVLLMTHYRSPMDWTAEKARQAEATLRKWREITAEVSASPVPLKRFDAILADDLNTAGAIAILHEIAEALRNQQNTGKHGAGNVLAVADDLYELARHITPDDVSTGLKRILKGSASLLGLLDDAMDAWASAPEVDLGAQTERLSNLRTAAMASKDFSAVDALKSALIAAGVEVRMSKAGVELVPGPDFDPAKLEALQ